jgi:uncharacterized membrane protein
VHRPIIIMPRRPRPTSPTLIRLVWIGVIVLVAIGVVAAIARGIFPADFGARLEPGREQLLDAFGRRDPLAMDRRAEIARFDRRFASHPAATLLHIVPGAVFLLLAPFQFSARIRRRHVTVHRWSGRLLLVAGTIGVISGLYFGLLMPYGGWGEGLAIALFGGLFLFALDRGYGAIRRRDVTRHREWMIRVFAIAIAISTVRIVAGVLDIWLTPFGFLPARLFVVSLWTGWLLTLGVAELWIRHMRPEGEPGPPDDPDRRERSTEAPWGFSFSRGPNRTSTKPTQR